MDHSGQHGGSPSLGGRAPDRPLESLSFVEGEKVDPRCQGNGVFNCAGPLGAYPSAPGILYESLFDVPEIPRKFDLSKYMTYYNYFNLWYTDLPEGGHFNQFVPQLYLGSVLCDSSNAVAVDGMPYKPIGKLLSAWHFGSMYYFALCEKGRSGSHNCSNNKFVSRAATGRLVAVQPGEKVWTRFVLGEDYVWTLSMGVVNGGPDRESHVTVAKPFMGLLPSTSSWTEDRYKQVSLGGCQENYYMEPGSIPSSWQVDITVIAAGARDFWQSWDQIVTARCPWAPKGKVISNTSRDWRSQTARWQIRMEQTG